ncbi:kinase-like domain-containing protein [Globomyces pollinis-pini]|nr:kinase-like domain-containing protein [Globomyces pollinis-pini]
MVEKNELKQQLANEAERLKLMASPYILEVVDYLSDVEINVPGQNYTADAALLLEHLNYGVLSDYLRLSAQNTGTFVLSQRLSILQMACKGLEYVHRMGFVHSKVKASSVYLQMEDSGMIKAKIGDFDMSVREGSVSVVLPDPGYVAPEAMVDGLRFSISNITSYDVYGFGGLLIHTILLENYPRMWNGLQKSYNEKREFLTKNIANQSLVQLIMQCLEEDPEARPIVSSILNSLYEFRQEDLEHKPIAKRFSSNSLSAKRISNLQKSFTLTRNKTASLNFTAGVYLLADLRLESPVRWEEFLKAFKQSYTTETNFNSQTLKEIIKPPANRVVTTLLDKTIFQHIEPLVGGMDEDAWILSVLEAIDELIVKCSVSKSIVE